MATGELPSGAGARLVIPGHSLSIITIAGPIVTSACARLPSAPFLRTSSSAPNVALQNSICAAGSRQNILGITTEAPSGIPFTFPAMLPSRPNIGSPIRLVL